MHLATNAMQSGTRERREREERVWRKRERERVRESVYV